jgi:hypothetical protein
MNEQGGRWMTAGQQRLFCPEEEQHSLALLGFELRLKGVVVVVVGS